MKHSASIKLAAALSLLIFLPAPAQAPTPPAQESPRRTDVEESVKVRLVMIDAVVVDSKDRTVPGLTKDDFLLFVDGEPRSIDTLDVDCSVGAVWNAADKAEPSGGEQPPDPASPRYLAMVIDYMHLDQISRAMVIDQAESMVREVKSDKDQVMLVALTGGIRIERAFTDDSDAILTALKRMKNDVTLWNGNFEHAHEGRFFEGLFTVLSLVETQPGAKALILFSNEPGRWETLPGRRPDEDDRWDTQLGQYRHEGGESSRSYDRDFAEVAAEASISRTALYPVHTAGLLTVPPFEGPEATPFTLARLAVDTGGQFTRFTNDLSMAFARAQRDLACRYTIGFYDRTGENDRIHSVRVDARDRGLLVRSPTSYMFRSPAVKRERIVTAAFLSPESFDTGFVRGHLFPLAPAPRGGWNAVLALDFPLELTEAEKKTTKVFGVSMVHGPKVVHSFNRTVWAEPKQSAAFSTKQFTFHEAVKNLEPGTYDLRVVVSDDDGAQVRATKVAVSLPRIPKKEIFLLPPVLFRPTGTDLFLPATGLADLERKNYGVTVADDGWGAPKGLQPLLIHLVPRTVPLSSLAVVCSVGKREGEEAAVIRRELLAASGEPLEKPKQTKVHLEGPEGRKCQSVLDSLPADLATGDYLYRVSLMSKSDDKLLDQHDMPFSVVDRSTDLNTLSTGAAPPR